MNRTDRLAKVLAEGSLALPESGTVLALGAEPSAAFGIIGRDRLRCEQSFRPSHDRLAAEGLSVAPDVQVEEGEAVSAAIVNISRHRAESLGLVARGLALLPENGMLVVVGSKSDGIESLMRHVAAVLPLDGRLSKAHGKVFWLTRPATLPDTVAEWAAGYALRRNAEGFVTGPGMFSPHAVDPGSIRLATQFDARLNGRVADLGAGWGWLAARALAGAPGIEALDLYEAEARALAAARANVTDARAGFHWRDVARLAAPDPGYDWAITNPPFHKGRAAEPDIGAAFIAAARRILKPAGRLLIVANRQLPYEAHLAAAFRAYTKLAEDTAFKVYLAERPRRD